jgi:hypothetical protein
MSDQTERPSMAVWYAALEAALHEGLSYEEAIGIADAALAAAQEDRA